MEYVTPSAPGAVSRPLLPVLASSWWVKGTSAASGSSQASLTTSSRNGLSTAWTRRVRGGSWVEELRAVKVSMSLSASCSGCGWAAGRRGAAPEAVRTLLQSRLREECWLKVENHCSHLASLALCDTTLARRTTSCSSRRVVGFGRRLYSRRWRFTRWLCSLTSSS